MAYNLESLVTVLQGILCSDQRELIDDKIIPQIESLLEKACFLRDSLKFADSATFGEDKIASLEERIRVETQNAENVLETYLCQLQRGPRSEIPPPDMHELLEDFNSTKEEMMKIRAGGGISRSASAAASSRSDPNPRKVVVGFTDDLVLLRDRVLEESTKLEIIPIIGMGGIGKTTLARIIYDDSSIVSHFDVRAWTTVSNDYNLHEILVDLLSCITGGNRDEMIQHKDHHLIHLHKSLMGKRYLIVLDDIWHSKTWDGLKMFLPNTNNGSRIILTTRESNVATYVDSKSPLHQVSLLNRFESWKLLRENVFGEESCPAELEEIGIEIANNCQGLPLSIHVVGGLLSHTKPTKDSWERVASNVSTTITNKDDQSLRILSLSYDLLPQHLKPCFLYMSAFPEDYEISAPKLIRLWVAEGFLKPIKDKSLEQVAEVYLEALIDRHLIFINSQNTNGKVKSCIIHDLLRDLCLTKARDKKFFHVMNVHTHNIPEDPSCMRRVSVHTSQCSGDIYNSIGQLTFSRSLLFIGPASVEIVPPAFSALELLRVLDALEVEFDLFPPDIIKLVNLRYLAFTCRNQLDPRITTFRNIQTLIVRTLSYTKVTHEIFNMPRLREIQFIGKPVWCDDVKASKGFVLQVNLHSLSTIEVSDFDIVLETIPNLQKLGIYYDSDKSNSMITNLACLRKLERLKISTDLSPKTDTFLSNLIFPFSLKRLSLSSCKVVHSCLKTIGLLPNLEILKMERVLFESEMWKPCEGAFRRLKYLRLEKLNLVDWQADETHFSRLQHMIIRHCGSLNEIPSGLGEISTLKAIEVYYSSPNVAASARKIQEEQLELGNHLLQVNVWDL